MEIEYESDVWQPLASCEGDAPAAHQEQPPSSDDFTFEERRAIATLLVEAVSRDDRLSDVFLGILLPPPWRSVHRHDDDEGEEPLNVLRSRLNRCVASIPSHWREMVCFMPMNMALKAGMYDSRLRVAMRRLCRLLAVPWKTVEKREAALSAVDLDELKDMEDKRGSILARKESSKVSIKRIAAVGTFAAVGGVALFFTGGLAAPIIAPAFSALLGATTATLGFVGGIGGALLGGGALAAAFGALIGLATHAAAMGALLTPLLTAANLTALFGAGGAGLAGWKGVRRTGESSRFCIRGIEDIESLPPLRVFGQDVKDVEKYGKGFSDDDELLAIAATPSAASRESPQLPSPQPDKGTSSGAVFDKRVSDVVSSIGDDFSDEMFSQSMSGLVVPVYTVNVTLRNIASSETLKSRSRKNVFAIECHLDGIRLSLTGMKLNFGVWAHVPAKEVPPRHAAVSACHNKVARPTGAGGVVCYRLARYLPNKRSSDGSATTTDIVPVDCPDLKYFRKEVRRLCADGGLKIWVLSYTTVTNTPHVSVVVERPSCKLSRTEIVRRLEADSVTGNTAYSVDDTIVVAVRFQPHPRIILRFHPNLGRPASHVSGSFLMRELAQHLEDNRVQIERRRVLTVVLKNLTSSTILNIKSIQCLTGIPQSGQALPSVIRPGEGGMMIFTNKEYSLEGAACMVAVETSNDDATAFVSGKLSCEVSAMGQCKAACLFHCGPLRQFPSSKDAPLPQLATTKGRPVPVASLIDAETTEPLTFLSASVYVNEKKDQVEWSFADASNRLVLSEVLAQRMTVSIGVCGFMDTIDPRRLLEDQQVAIWQPIFREHELFRTSQGLVVDWEEEYLRRFSQTVGLLKGERFVNEATGEVIHQGKKAVKRQLLAGALFAGLRAFDALKGTVELPLYAIYATDLIDNTFATLSNRAEYAGKDLALALLSDKRGNRPVTLVGFSFGATVIAKCLQELHNEKALGIVENVYLLGGVFSSDLKVWRSMRNIVAGRIVNIYCRSDWLLWTLHKANALQLKPLAGLAPVYGVPGVENIDASALIDSHASYAIKLESILDLIPEFPNPSTLQQSSQFGSPGALVPSGEVMTAVERMFSSMTTPLFESDAGVVALTNRIDSGGTFIDDLKFVASKVHHETAFDFTPVPSIPTRQSGVFGFLRDHRLSNNSSLGRDINAPGNDEDGGTDGDETKPVLCGVVGYSLALSPVFQGSVLVMLYFTCVPDEARGVRCNAVAMSVPLRVDETADAFQKRLVELVENQGSCADEVARIALLGPQSPGQEVRQEFNAIAETAEGNDWSITMKLEDGGAVCALEGTVSMEVLDESWTELLGSRQQSDEGLSLVWDRCPVDHGANIPLDGLSYVVQDLVRWGVDALPLEVLSSSRSTILSSSHAKSHILFPIVLVNTTPFTLTLAATFTAEQEKHLLSSSSDAEWLRSPPSLLKPQTAAVLLLRVAVLQPFSDAAQNKFSDLYACFSYSSDDGNQFQFFVKMQWEVISAPLDGTPTSPSPSLLTDKGSPNGTSSKLLSFDLRVQCLHDAGVHCMSGSTFDAVVEDVKRIDGVSLRFIFLRQPPAEQPQGAETIDEMCKEGDHAVRGQAASQPERDSKHQEDGTPWVMFDDES